MDPLTNIWGIMKHCAIQRKCESTPTPNSTQLVKFDGEYPMELSGVLFNELT